MALVVSNRRVALLDNSLTKMAMFLIRGVVYQLFLIGGTLYQVVASNSRKQFSVYPCTGWGDGLAGWLVGRCHPLVIALLSPFFPFNSRNKQI